MSLSPAQPASEVYFPIMKIGGCLFVSVPPQLRDAHVRALQDAVAARLVAERDVRGLVVDVSALSLVDSYVAKVLGEIGGAATSLGVRGVLVGLRPAVAITLVELGLDLGGVETAMSLERALRRLGMRVVTDT